MIIFHQISREMLQMKFDKQEWATRGNFVSHEIRNHDRKTYSKTSIPWEKKILWCNHNYSDSRCNSQFNESKSIQIIVRTNIKQQLTPPPLSQNCSKRSVDSGNNFKARDANAPPLWKGRRTHLTNEIFLESYVKDRVSRQLFGFFCSRG